MRSDEGFLLCATNFKPYLTAALLLADSLKEFAPDHPVIEQLANFNTLDEIEKMLQQNFDYCDDCLLKMYRKFAGGNAAGACPCGDEEEEPIVVAPDTPPGGG